MFSFVKRNMLVFFRDRSSVFFSFLGVIVIISLYAVFLGDVFIQSMKGAEGIRYLMDSWIMAGLISVCSVTATMGALGAMVDDRSRKLYRDFHVSPFSRGKLAAGYILCAFVVSVVMCVFTLVLAEIYILVGGGEMLSLLALSKVLGIILLSALPSSAMLFFMVSFFKSNSAFGAASTVIGTLIGFLTGIYIPIGNLPASVQTVIRFFPVSHSSVLLRQVMMEQPMEAVFAGAPAEHTENFKQVFGVVYRYGDYTAEPWLHIAVLLATAAVFFALSVMSLRRKSNK